MSQVQTVVATTRCYVQNSKSDRSKGKQTRHLWYDVAKILEAFTIEVQNKYSALLETDEEEHGPEELWEELVKITKETAESYIQKRPKMRKPWLMEDTLDTETSGTKKRLIHGYP